MHHVAHKLFLQRAFFVTSCLQPDSTSLLGRTLWIYVNSFANSCSRNPTSKSVVIMFTIIGINKKIIVSENFSERKVSTYWLLLRQNLGTKNNNIGCKLPMFLCTFSNYVTYIFWFVMREASNFKLCYIIINLCTKKCTGVGWIVYA